MVVFIRKLLAAILSFSIAVAAFADANNHTTTYAHDQRGRRDLPPSSALFKNLKAVGVAADGLAQLAALRKDYDAFGVLIHQTGTTPNPTLFAGEQFDPDLGLYYNRARYLNVSTGRFINMDSFEGDSESPMSLHKYLYAASDPINNSDRSGHDFDLGSTLVATTGGATIFSLSAIQSAAVINGVLGALLASSTAGIGAYIEGKNPEQIADATGNLYNVALGSLIGIAGGFAGAYRVGRFVLTVIAIGGGDYQAQKEYKAGNVGAAFYYGTLGLLAAGLINVVPALAKNAAFLGAPDAPPVGPGTSSTEEIVLFRGVPQGHPGYDNATQGIANPWEAPNRHLGILPAIPTAHLHRGLVIRQ